MKSLQTPITFFIYLMLSLSVLTLTSAVKAQTQGSVAGKVSDDNQKPLDFATVSLLKAADSAFVKSSITDSTGSYLFEKVEAGNYLVKVTFSGYKKSTSKLLTVTPNNQTLVPVIVLNTDSKTLKEVSITVKKPFLERKADKLILNVEGSAVAVGNTALEVLQKAPGVTLDKDDNLSMSGKSSVLVMLDGKPTYMSNADLANMLRSMQSTQIETIELITNPSAKYDAAGNGGIINIKTKRNRKLGFNGSTTIGSGYGQTTKYNGSTNLNFRKGKINLFGSYNYSNNGNRNIFELNRKVTDENAITNFDQDNNWNSRRNNNGYKVGVDLFATKKTTIGFLVNGYDNSVNEKSRSGTAIFKEGFSTDSSIDVSGRNKQKYANMAYNLNFKTNLDTLGREITIDADYSNYNGRSNEFRDSYYSNFKDNAPVEFINNLAPSKIEVVSAKLDYTHPVSKTFKIETGLKSSWVTTDNNLQFSTLSGSTWISNRDRSNHFIYKENINAAYINLNKEYKSTTVQLGLRGEHTNSNGNSITLNSEVPRDYFQLFPSVSLSHKMGKDHQLGISYSRRIDRPSYDKLNPFVNLLDKYTFEQGNPYLNPQYSNSAQLSYTFKGAMTANLSYSKTTDVMTQITEQNNATKVTYAQERNLDNQTVYSFNVFVPVPVRKWWSMNTNAEVFNLGFTSDLFGERLEVNKTAFQINTDNQFTITKTIGAEISGWYRSPLQYGIFRIQNAPFVNIGLRKSFDNSKVNLKLSLNDVLNTQINKGATKYSNMNFNFMNKWESRVVSFSLSYRFGSKENKPERRRSTGLESEANRMKN